MTDPIDVIRKQVEDRVTQEASQASTPEDEEKIPRKLIKSCLDANELGDGILYSTLFRDELFFNKNSQEWYEWAGHFWQRDIMSRSLAVVEKVVALYLEEAKRVGQEIIEAVANSSRGDGGSEDLKKLKAKQEALFSRVRQLRAEKRRRACINFSHTIDNPLAIAGEELDSKPMLFPCKNGVIDLETGRINPGRPLDYLSLASKNVEFLGIDEPAPLWEKSLLEIFNGNEDLVAYLQRLFGYCMTGLVCEKVFPVLYGSTGWNGRSLIVETISHVMGDLAGPIPSEMLLSQKFSKSASGPSPDIMSLKGRRLATASEIDEGQRFSVAKIKWLTGKDELLGRNPHDKYQTRFPPTHKLILMTNTQPSAPPDDKAFWERLHLIPFKISFVNRDPRETYERRANTNLDKQILAEAPGILAWLVRGCLLWQQHGLKPPKEITEATEHYRRNEDLLADFIEECCKTGPAENDKAAALFNRFKKWYEENVGKTDKLTGTWFGKQLSKKFSKTKSHGNNIYHGISLNDEIGG